MGSHENLDPALAAVLERIRSGQATRPEDADLLEHHLTTDAMVPGVRNRAAWQQHVKNYGNAGVYLHADLNDFGQVNKEHGEDVGDETIKAFGKVLQQAGARQAARTFRKGGDEFVQWYLHPEHAVQAMKEIHEGLQAVNPQLTASLGLGYGRHQAEEAMRVAKGQKSEQPQTLTHSFLDSTPPLGWQPAEERIKGLRRQALGGAPEADVVRVPGSQDDIRLNFDAGAALKKDDQAVIQARPQHPLFAGHAFTMMSGEEPRYPTSFGEGDGHQALKDELLRRGRRFEETQGFYGRPERSFVIYDLPLAEARELGKKFGQESVIHSDGQQPILFYTNGQDADHFHPTQGWNASPQPPADPNEGWTKVFDPATRQPIYTSLKIDWDTKKPIRALESGAHPHAYDWHDDDGVGTPPEVQKGFATMDDFPEAKKAEGNEQAAGVGVNTFGATVAPWGQVTPGKATNLRHYDFRPFKRQIEDMAAQHGYRFNYMGPGKIPDLKKENYNHRVLHIWDPEAGSGGDFGEREYTDSWRKSHELAHALTYGAINDKYGEGRRIGKLGHHRTPTEAKRAVEWEYMAAHKQRELGQQVGHHISDEDFNKELNTVMADAVHRAIHGTFTEPSQEGFQPHGHAVPLETALKTIDDHAARMGLGPHDTLKSKAVPQPGAKP